MRAVVLGFSLVLAACAPSTQDIARELGRGIGEGLAAGMKDGAGPVDPVAIGEALGRGMAQGAAEALREYQEREALRQRDDAPPPAPGLPQLPKPMTH